MKSSERLMDEAEAQVLDGVRTARRALRDAGVTVSEGASRLRDNSAPILERIFGRAGDAARHVAHDARDGAQQVRTRIERIAGEGAAAVRERPAQALLVVVAVGALAFAVSQLAARRSSR